VIFFRFRAPKFNRKYAWLGSHFRNVQHNQKCLTLRAWRLGAINFLKDLLESKENHSRKDAKAPRLGENAPKSTENFKYLGWILTFEMFNKTTPKLVTPECFNRGSSPKFAWIPAKACWNTDKSLVGFRGIQKYTCKYPK
jgi:hypothetical protein